MRALRSLCLCVSILYRSTRLATKMTIHFLNRSIPNDWLDPSPTTLSRLRSELCDPALPESFVAAYSRMLDEVEQLMQPGDVLYRFASPSGTWTEKLGLAGFVIMRDGRCVHAIEIARN